MVEVKAKNGTIVKCPAMAGIILAGGSIINLESCDKNRDKTLIFN